MTNSHPQVEEAEGKREYAIRYLRPDGWWVAGEGWDNYWDCRAAANEHDWRGSQHKIAVVGKGPHREAVALEEREGAR